MEAVRFRENQSEEQTIKILKNLNNHKKKVFKKIDENINSNWRNDAVKILIKGRIEKINNGK